MILIMTVSSEPTTSLPLIAHHKFVKTTPKPRATKNRSGELVGPLGLLFVGDIVGVAVADVCEAGDAAVEVCPEFRFLPAT